MWLKDAPTYSKDDPLSAQKCVDFIDSFITCSSKNDEVNEEYIAYQKHKHSHTCKKNSSKAECRFNFPQYPMSQTMILEPLSADDLKDYNDKNNQHIDMSYLIEFSKLIKDQLNIRWKENDLQATYEEYLEKLGINHELYIIIIRSSIKRAKVFLKRELIDIRTNCYNSKILQQWKANMDIQFVLDVYSCIVYILQYISKGDRGMSKVLRDAIKDIRKGNMDIRHRLKTISEKFLHATEISAQEAVYYLLGMNVSESSRLCSFINTSLPDKRIHLVKSKEELELLNDDNSTDIYSIDSIEYYEARHDYFEKYCLAEFISYLNIEPIRKSKKRIFQIDEIINDDIEDKESEVFEENSFEFKSNSRCKGKMAKIRKHPKIIRFVNFDRKKSESDYYREQIMLFTHWRNEINQIVNIDHKATYYSNLTSIEENKKKFYFYNESDTLMLEIIQDEIQNTSLEDPETFDKEDDKDKDDDVFGILATDHHEIDLYETMGIKLTDRAEKYNKPKDFTFENYKKLILEMNEQQRRYLMNINYIFKTSKTPIFHVITGQAGVGKSRLINGIFQSLNKFFLKAFDSDKQEVIRIIMAAPTGIAAFNIEGQTCHGAFNLPFNLNKSNFQPLSMENLNTIRANLLYLKVIIIDEISMTSSDMFQCINLRLQQIFQNKLPFGGISVIVFGDFWQLPPVASSFCFKVPKGYNELVGPLLWEQFKLFELTEIMRQKEDLKFAEALNALGSGSLTEEQTLMFKSRERITGTKGVINVFYTNQERILYNNLVIKENESELIVSEAIDKVYGKLTTEEKNHFIETFKKLPEESTSHLLNELLLKIGIRYYIVINVDNKDGIVNGASGHLMHISQNSIKEPTILWIKFENERVGQNLKKTINSRIYQSEKIDSDLNWIPIKRLRLGFPNRSLKKDVIIYREQFPVDIGEGKTAHKVQGCTYKQIVVHASYITKNSKNNLINKKQMNRAALYVACSRATSLDGLQIIGQFVKPPDIKDDNIVKIEMERLRKYCQLKLELQFVEDLKTPDDIQIVFHNIQSINNKIDLIEKDIFYNLSNIIILSEAWISSSITYNLKNYVIVNKITNSDVVSNRNKGSITYVKLDSQHYIQFLESSIGQHNDSYFIIEAFLLTVALPILLLSIYKAPNFPKKLFLEKLTIFVNRSSKKYQYRNIIIGGDFNINLKEDDNLLKNFMNETKMFNCLPKNHATTDYNTQIDLCFTNLKNIKCNYFESLLSDHKPFWLLINKDDVIYILILYTNLNLL